MTKQELDEIRMATDAAILDKDYRESGRWQVEEDRAALLAEVDFLNERFAKIECAVAKLGRVLGLHDITIVPYDDKDSDVADALEGMIKSFIQEHN